MHEIRRFPEVPKRPVALAHQIRNAILAALQNGRIRPGDKLVIEQIAAELGVSRTPVREALQRLAAEGFADIIPRRGTVLKRFSTREILDAYDVRAVVEGYAAQLAATRATPEAMEGLRANCNMLAKGIADCSAGKTVAETLRQFDSQFHGLVHEMSGNSAIAWAVAGLWNIPRLYAMFSWESPEHQRISLDYHTRLIEAIAARRPALARAVMREHLLKSKELLATWFHDTDGQKHLSPRAV